MKPETLTKAIARQAEKVDAGTKKKVLKGTLKSADGIRVLAQTEYDKKGNPKMKDDETWKLRL